MTGSDKSWVRRLAGYCWQYRRSLLLAFGGAIVATGALATVPLIQRSIIDDVVLDDDGNLPVLGVAMITLAALAYVGAFSRRYFGGRLALDVQHDLRLDMLTALIGLDGAKQDRLHTGQVIGRTTSDITMMQALLMMLPMLTGNVLLFVTSLVIMLTLSPLLTIVALAVGPGLWVVAQASRNRLFPASWHAQQEAGMVAATVEGAVTGVRVVKGFGQERQELTKLERAAAALFASRSRVVRLTSFYNPTLQAVPALGQVGVLALGGWLAINGRITLGTFLAFSAYLAQLVGPVRMLAMVLTVGQQARASVVRVFEVIDTKPTIDETPDAPALPSGDMSIEFDDVTFGYNPDQPALHGLSLTIEPGQTVAVVGSSGSGKSTLTQLLMRFYDVGSGSVRVAGHDVRNVSVASLRAAIGSVAEESVLFSDTVRENIRYGRPGATDSEVEAAARATEAHGFVLALPDGYDTVVGEHGLTLSGGQRQRVSLARALITNPPILLLDDATSAVDAQVEERIHAHLRSKTAHPTTLIIAHRRSTLRLADRIAVLDGGQIVDIGTEAELQARSDLFRRLLTGLDEIDDVVAELHTATGGITTSLWQRSDRLSSDIWRPASETSGVASAGAGRGRTGIGAGGPMSGALAGAPPTPDLLAKVTALPPASDTPQVDDAAARAPDPRFSLARLLRPLWRPVIIGLAFVALDAAATLLLPVLIRHGIDAGVTNRAMDAIVVMSLAGLAVVIADWIFMRTHFRIMGRTGERLLYTLRVKAFAHLQRLGLDYYERTMSGRIMTRMTTDIDALSNFLQTGLATAVVSLLTFLGVLIALIIIDASLALVVLAVLPVLIVATVVFQIKAARSYSEARERVSAVNADLQENVSGLRVTQAYGREAVNHERFAAKSRAYRNARVRGQRYIAMYFPSVQFLAHSAALLVLVVGSGMVHDGTLTAGALIAYLLYIDLVFSPVQQLSQVFDGYQQAAVGLRRIKELLRTRTSTPRPADPEPVPERLHGRIEFDNVHFHYDGSDHTREALDSIDLTIEPGETLAVVGQTGAGKSTLVKLVARFYDPTAGTVRVDGIDLRQYNLARYRHRLGIVPQETYLFPGTVRDAIAYGRPDAADTDVERAARAVGAHDMIATLPGGYHHHVDERGRNFSNGQRQLIALARAQLVDPDILLMDEATAALDLATEAAVTRAADQLTARRTTIVVAHRLTTAARADRIAVVDKGRIVEIGTHEQLIAAGGAYATAWRTFATHALHT
jgi:ATP-binding cassette subfamily B protein